MIVSYFKKLFISMISIIDLIKETSAIDSILDKISSKGISSLSDFEKEVLSKGDSKSTKEKITYNWLSTNYSNLTPVKEKRKSFGKDVVEIHFLSKDADSKFTLNTNNNIIYLEYGEIVHYLGDFFEEDVFLDWFEDKYKIRPSEASLKFTNKDH